MMHKAWSSIEEVSYCFPRSSVKFQGHAALKIVEFDPNWAFPDCNFSLNSPMAMKCYTKLETAKEWCPIVFQGHPSNFKVTRDKTSPILTQIGRFRTIGRSQLSNPSDLPCYHFSHFVRAQICLRMQAMSKYHIYYQASTNDITYDTPAWSRLAILDITVGNNLQIYRCLSKTFCSTTIEILAPSVVWCHIYQGWLRCYNGNWTCQ